MPVRIIPRLDIKAPHLVKGVRLEGLRVVGDPSQQARRYFEDGADELLFMDIVASLYGRSQLLDLVRDTADHLFVPLTVGGGVRSIDDIHALLRSGADRVAINTAAIHNPALIRDAARVFGSQCVTVGIEAIRQPDGSWQAFTDNGREPTGRDAVAWAEQAVAWGAGELLLTSVDREGTRQGYDTEWIQEVSSRVPVPVIASGGAGRPEHLSAALAAGASGLAVASLLHHGACSIADLRTAVADRGVEVRA